jgi:hypothetical protein
MITIFATAFTIGFVFYFAKQKFVRSSALKVTKEIEFEDYEEDYELDKTIKVFHHCGSKYWQKDGQFHREDGPAIEHKNGDKHWWLNGERHREGGLPTIEFVSGMKFWHKNNKWIRTEYFNSDGELHREGGPAIEHADGGKEWYVNGKRD